MESYDNEYVNVTYYPKTDNNSKAYIICRDLTDVWNETTCFTQNVRGIDKAWQFIGQIFNKYELTEDIKFRDVRHILDDKFNLKTHQYCVVD